MKLRYSLDVNEKSTWFVNTPSPLSKKLPFYINECGHYIANSTYYTERQGQSNFLLMYTLSGTGSLRYNNQEYILEQNQAVVIDCNNYHIYKTFSEEPWAFRWIHFNGIAAKEYYSILNEETLNIVYLGDFIAFEKMLDNLNKYFDVNDIPSCINTATQMTSIISMLITCKFTSVNNKKYDEHRSEIDKVIDFIQSNYGNKISLDDLTKTAYISKFHFLRLFKRHTGVSPYEYLINYRINKAKELLKNSELLIREISDTVGFFDYNNFIREFKKIVGITPLKYKKQN
jgi:AraC-like DNA-binding protein